MYIFEEMIEMGLKEGQQWTSDDHRIVAINVCICNPNIFDRGILQDNVSIINKIPQDKIRLVTLEDLNQIGVVF